MGGVGVSDLINLMEWNQFAEDRKTLLEALTILNNRHREVVGKLECEKVAMREAIREASRQLEFALDMWRQHHNNSGNERPPDLKSLPTIEGERWNEGRATIAKLQPFIK